MKKSVALLSGLSMAALTSMIVSASAADVMVEESAFEGFYFGAHGGYAWADSEIDYTGNYGTSVSLNGPRPGGGPIDGTANVSSEGALIGAQLGANFVAGNGFLIGAEVSASWGAIAGDEVFDDGDVTVNVEQNISALGLAQAKLGWAHDRFAIYGLGGLAIGQVETSASLGAGDGFPLDINLDDDRTMTGWTLGAGADFMVTENVSLGLTYNYIDLGDYDTSYTVNENYFIVFNVFGEIDTNTSVNMHVVKATLNYNF